ncbi:MAG: ABC transporter transmembrane domain-containing protein [Rhodoluna sp.]
MASLQGHAVPWHRFAMLSHGVNGAALKDLPVASVAAECWRARFPAGEIKLAEMPLNRGDAPALWLGPEQPGSVPQAYIVRGSLSSGALSCLDDKGRAVELPQAQAVLGQVLVLRADEPLDSTVTDGMSAAPRSAAAWFRYAILKRRRVFIEAAVATLTVNFIGLASSFYSMQVYDRVIPTGGYPTLWVMTIGVLLAMVIELAMRMVRARLVERNCKAIDEELSGVFFGHALAIRMDQRPRTVGTFAAQIRHFEMVRNFMTSTTLFVMADAPFALLFVIVIALIAGPVALVPLLFVPVAIFAGLAFRKPLARLSENHMQESNRKNGLLIEVIDGIESVKAASGEWKMLDRWLDLTRTLGRNEIAIKDITSLSTNLTQSLQQLSYVGLIAAGAYAIGAGYLTVGGLIACTIISGRALSPIAQISGLIVQWQQARVALKGLDSIMALPTDSQPGERRFVPDRCDGRLRLESLKFAYGPDMSALTVDALSVKPGERVAVLGTVGSGKSTLVKLLSGLYRPQEGRVFLDDVDVTHLAPEFVREHIGYLPQDVRLFQGTLRENLALGLPSPTDDQILTAARMTGLDRLLLTHPK